MSSYQDFAGLYDALTFDVDYPKIADFICSRLQAKGITDGLVLDLACGTGTLTVALQNRGYDMTGVDASEEMLAVARGKEGAEGILFLHQPMEAFELYGTVDAIVCVLDSLNYLTDPDDLVKTFKLCANYLNPDGVLLFDVNSEYKVKHILGNQTYSYETDSIYYIWENEFNPETGLCDLYLTFFTETEDGLYRRVDEVQTQRLYTDKEITEALAQAGLQVVCRYDDYTRYEPHDKSQRIVYEVKKI
ncbi:MAG: class I SAM-dependent methyltransferase [Ruminococcaceae bacterium]|nr:class I SAM-dependent methyltransferase [Oscillospiraceae bacterium]